MLLFISIGWNITKRDYYCNYTGNYHNMWAYLALFNFFYFSVCEKIEYILVKKHHITMSLHSLIAHEKFIIFRLQTIKFVQHYASDVNATAF